jgi:hypothetical protein
MDAVWHGMAQRPTINTGRFYGFLSSTQHVGWSEHRGVRWCTGIPWSSSKAPIHIHEKIIRGESGLWLHRLLHLHRMGSTVIPVIEAHPRNQWDQWVKRRGWNHIYNWDILGHLGTMQRGLSIWKPGGASLRPQMLASRPPAPLAPPRRAGKVSEQKYQLIVCKTV